MTKYVLPLEIIGLVLTAAMIGAVLIALRESKAGSSRGNEAQIKIGNQPQAAGIQLEPSHVGSYKEGIGGLT